MNDYRRSIPSKLIAKVIPATPSSGLPRAALDPVSLAGLVELAAPAAAVSVEFAPAVELAESGPVRKKLPAMGLPSPVCSANNEMLKLLMGVDELRIEGTTSLKFAGCTNSRRMYLRLPSLA